MSVVKKNIAANFAGSIWQTVISLLFVPVYIEFLGIEAWGVVGLFVSLQAIFGLLDMGFSATLNREMARLSAISGAEQEMKDLVRTLEVLYWGIAITVLCVVIASAPILARHWLNPEQLSPAVIQRSLFVMGFAIALQMPIGFYSGGLLGLQTHVLLNFLNFIISSARALGAVLALWLYAPTIQVYFGWQAVVSVLNLALVAYYLWRKIPDSKTAPTFRYALLKGVWRFTAGMSGITVLGVILTQMDKFVLSKILTLETFGYYSLASMVALSLLRLSMPIFTSVYPRFTQLASGGNAEELARLYHRTSQLVVVLVLPVAVVIAAFSREIILLWTQSELTAENTHLLVTILISGTALNCLMYPPYALQLAFGWTKLSIYKNIIAVALFFPSMIYMAQHYGAVGAATMWLLLNIGYFIFEIPVMHMRLLPKEKKEWYFQDVGKPMLAAIVTVLVSRFFIDAHEPRLILFLKVILAFCVVMMATLRLTPAMRNRLSI